MRLQDFLGTTRRYDVKAIAADKELSRQIQVRLIDLGLLEPPADGVFGPASTAALTRFQKLSETTQEPGFLGPITAKKLIEYKPTDLKFPPPILKIVNETFFKAKVLDSANLSANEKHLVEAGKIFELLSYERVRNHFQVVLRKETIKNSRTWYLFAQHIQILEEGKVVYPKFKPKSFKLTNFPYFSQMDNYYNPTGSCNVTSMAMCLQYLNKPRRSRVGQFEDELYDYAIKKGYSRWSPYDLAKIVRDYGAQDKFKENATIEEIQDWLVDKNPVVIHGYFTPFGHIMPVVGYDENGLFVHDPFGEWFPSGYNNYVSGAFLHYSYSLIRRVCMPDGNFWVHFISR